MNSKEFKLSQAKCEEFGEWYLQYRRSHQTENPTKSSQTIESLESANNTGTSGITERVEIMKSNSEARLTFHPKQEVPRLVEWFQLNRNPSDHILSYYADMLNQSSLRAERFV